ncbi:PROTEIN CYCLOPS [Salix purpurea]|uniref:PROTEIN CYCLOPS n=1 Tax=Salix purpurea TaxID=77065 RepID=A0A9Q0TIB2_SALPP|nr:PROTEIN CYCLOPS [Salix purpurea]
MWQKRRYAAMQCARTNTGVEAMQDVSGHGVNNLKHEFGNPNGFTSSSSTFNTPQIENETAEDSFDALYHAQEVIINSTSDQGKGNGIQEIPPGSFLSPTGRALIRLSRYRIFQKQNEELTDEKERLLEEIERILAETGKM